MEKKGKDALMHDAIIILGAVKDEDSVWPNFDYPFSKAEEDAVNKLKERGFKNIGVYREPDSKNIRKILAGENLKAVELIGHGEYIGSTYSFTLNDKENISAGTLRQWAMEDVVLPRYFTGEAQKILNENPAFSDAVLRSSGYNFDFAVAYTCHSMRDPELRRALGGEFEGNPWYSTVTLPPICSTNQQTLSVRSDAFSKDPVNAFKGALEQSIKNLESADSSFEQPGYRTALSNALADLIVAVKSGKNVQSKVIDAIRKQFAVKFDTNPAAYGSTTTEEDEKLLKKFKHSFEVEVYECGAPTIASLGELGCRHRVRGGGPCWQHDEWYQPKY